MLALLLACTGAPLDSAEAASPAALTPSEQPDPEDCKTSCSLGDQTDDVHLTHPEIEVLLADWNAQPLGASTIELDTLLFYFHDTEEFLHEHGAVGLDAQHEEFLRRELARDTVTMEMRLLDSAGQVRGTVPPTEIPLKEKQHITFAGTGSLKHLETGGKVKRVGLAHLWSRW